MRRLLCVGLIALCSCFFTGCPRPAEPVETEEDVQADLEAQQKMMEEETGGSPAAPGQPAPKQ